MGHLDEIVADMRHRGLRPATARLYTDNVCLVQRHFGERSLATLSKEDLRGYFLHLEAEGRLSAGSRRIRVFALRFFYRHTLGNPELADQITIPRKSRVKPAVLSRGEVARLLAATRSPKYRAIFMTLYGAGLRVFEAVALKISDVLSDRMLLYVAETKGGGDRYAMLSPRLLEEQERAARAGAARGEVGLARDKPSRERHAQALGKRGAGRLGLGVPSFV